MPVRSVTQLPVSRPCPAVSARASPWRVPGQNQQLSPFGDDKKPLFY